MAGRRIIDLDEDELDEHLDAVLDRRFADLASKPPERLLTKQQLGEVLGVSTKSVDRLREQGMPDLMVLDSVRFELDAVLAWLRARSATPSLRVVGGGK